MTVPALNSSPSTVPAPAAGGAGRDRGATGPDFAELLASLAQAQPGVPAAAQARVASAHPAELARMFNEEGFFPTGSNSAAGQADTDPERLPAGSGPAAALAAPPGSGVRQDLAASERPADVPFSGTSLTPPGAANRGTTAPAMSKSVQPGRHAALPAARPAADAVAEQVREEVEDSAQVSTRAARRSGGTGAAEPARLALRLEAGEAAVVAQAAGLSPEQRARLRAEIAGLLGRHGFGLASLRLNGRAERTSQS